MKKFGICLGLALAMAIPANVSAASGVTAEAYYEDIADSLGFEGDAEEALKDAYIIEDADEFPIDGGDYLTRADVAILANRVYRYTQESEFVDTMTQWFDEDYAELWVEYLRRAKVYYAEERVVGNADFDRELFWFEPSIAYSLALDINTEEDEKFYALSNQGYGDSENYDKYNNTYVEEGSEEYWNDPFYAIFAAPLTRAQGGIWHMEGISRADGKVYLTLISASKDDGYYRYMYKPIVGDLFLKDAMMELGYVTDLDEIPEDYQEEVLFAITRGFFKGYKDGDGIELRGENNITVNGAANVLAMAVGEKDMAVTWDFDSIMTDYFATKEDLYFELNEEKIHNTFDGYPEKYAPIADWPRLLEIELENLFYEVEDEGNGRYDATANCDLDGDGIDEFEKAIDAREVYYDYIVER